ncbi:MAG TPA: heparinase II/III family protein [Vicinamibacteria bacterium]|nr:heparinase II/III family protein [Vicinamibacteria bacterium]
MTRLLELGLALSLAGAAAGGHDGRPDLLASGARPRVLLTAERLAELKALRPTSHREPFAVARGEADTYLSRPLPADRSRAINAYRGHGQVLPGLALMYRLTDDSAYLEAARRWLRCLVGFETWDGSQNLGRASFATGVSLAYDWLHDVLSPPERAAIRDRLLREGRILAPVVAAQHRLLSNHLHNEMCGLAMIGYALWGEEAEAERFVAVAEEKARVTLEHAPPDGAWPEGPSYWGYGLSYLLRMLEAKRLLGRGDDFATNAWLRSTGDYFVYLSLPEAAWARGTVVANIADAPLDGGPHGGVVLRRLASAYGNGVYQHMADSLMRRDLPRGDPADRRETAHGTWMHLLWYDPAVAPTPPDRLPTMRHFDDMGLVSMRSGWGKDAAVLVFHAGSGPGRRNMGDPQRAAMRGFGPGHAHPDINAFSIFARGQWLAVDPGYSQVKDTRDHNTVVVNGRGQAGEGDKWLDYWAFQQRSPAPSIRRAETTARYDTVLGDAGAIYVDEARLRRFRRQVLFLKPDVFVIADDIEAQGPSRFEWLLHAPERSLSLGKGGAFEIARPGVRLHGVFLRPATARGRVVTRVTGSSGFDPTSCLVEEMTGEAARPLAVLSVLGEGEAPPRVRLAEDRLLIRKGEAEWTIRVADEPAAPDVPLLVVDVPARPSPQARPAVSPRRPRGVPAPGAARARARSG